MHSYPLLVRVARVTVSAFEIITPHECMSNGIVRMAQQLYEIRSCSDKS